MVNWIVYAGGMVGTETLGIGHSAPMRNKQQAHDECILFTTLRWFHWILGHSHGVCVCESGGPSDFC